MQQVKVIKNNMEDPVIPQTEVQKKIALAQSDHAPTIILLLKDLMKPIPLLGSSEYETLVNAVRFDTQSEILRGMVDYLEDIRKGSLHGPKA